MLERAIIAHDFIDAIQLHSHTYCVIRTAGVHGNLYVSHRCDRTFRPKGNHGVAGETVTRDCPPLVLLVRPDLFGFETVVVAIS